jgi:hypothetical protein
VVQTTASDDANLCVLQGCSLVGEMGAELLIIQASQEGKSEVRSQIAKGKSEVRSQTAKGKSEVRSRIEEVKNLCPRADSLLQSDF